MQTAWVHFRGNNQGEPQIVRSSHASIAVAKSTERNGELIITFPNAFHVQSCVATPWERMFLQPRVGIIPPEIKLFPSATIVTAIPGDQVHPAPNQVRLQYADFDYEAPGIAAVKSYNINLVVYGTANLRATFTVQGRHLYDDWGEQVILRGVNKMAVYTTEHTTCYNIFPEIRKTGANAVRIVWGTEALTDDEGLVRGATVANLDAAIQNCRDNHMVPLIELHDATGDWSKLNSLVDYWTRPEVVNLIRKHQRYLLVNIANEASDASVTTPEFKAAYTRAITRMRNAGIRVPLMIDAADWGKDLDYFFSNQPGKENTNAQDLMALDDNLTGAGPNLLFSLHAYWYGFTEAGTPAAQYLAQKIDEFVLLGIPLVLGEFSGKSVDCTNDSPYLTVLEKCHQHGIGWFAWEWGPGNELGNPPCPEMNMTANGKHESLQAGWATEVAVSSPYSIQNTSVTAASLR